MGKLESLDGECSNLKFKKSKLSLPAKLLLVASTVFLGSTLEAIQTQAITAANISLPWVYSYSTNGNLDEATSVSLSQSPYWWVKEGSSMSVSGGVGNNLSGQNMFAVFERTPELNTDQSVSVKINKLNLANVSNRNPWNNVSLYSRWIDDNNYYYMGIRQDGAAAIKKKVNGAYYTLATKQVFSGTYNSSSSLSKDYNLIPMNTWMKIRGVTYTDSSGNVRLKMYIDKNSSGSWELLFDVTDSGATDTGAKIMNSGLNGLREDYMDISMDNYSLNNVKTSDGSIVLPVPTPTLTPTLIPTPIPTPTVTNSNVLFSDTFSEYLVGLITNEYAYWNPTDPKSVASAKWQLDSGSLFSDGSSGWTGIPNSGTPNALSTNVNNSTIFRLVTKQSDFGDVSVSFDLLNQGLSSTSATPAADWDGLHIFLRYQSEYNLYYASINRRDNTVVIKKKVPGGPSNGGTYYALNSYSSHPVPYKSWQKIRATVKNNADGSVTIKLYADDVLVSSATDNGTIGGAPIRTPGKVGVRGDNANLKFKNFVVSSI
jgi:hypothetical protein